MTASPPTDKQQTDHIIGECLMKAAHVILGSRSEPNKQPVQHPGRKTWFNLNIDEVAAASQVFDNWRKDTNTPAFIEVYMRPWGPSGEQTSLQPSTSGQQDICLQTDAFPAATLLERWMFHFEACPPDGNLQRRRAQLARLDPPAVYKRAVVMLRSLTSYVRLLPGYRMYKACKRSSSSPARLGFCLLKGHQSSMGSTTATHLRHFSFTPLETPYGQFKLEVDYAPAAAVNFLEQSTSSQHQAEIILDYVRGAQPADKQRLSHNALRGGLTASLQGSWRQPSLANPAAAERTEEPQRSSSLGLRRHSWSREVVRISPPSPSAATPFATGGRPPLASPGSHEAGLMPSPSLPVPSLEKGQALPAAQPRMQRTISTPAQPQALPSWRPDLPEVSLEDIATPSSPLSYPHPVQGGYSRQHQGVDEQPLPCSSPPVHGIPARQPCYRSTGTDPVCIPTTKPRVFSSNDLTSLGPSAWSEMGSGARAGPPETVMVRQYGFPSCQGSAPSSAPASTGFAPPAGNRQVGLLRAVAAKPPMSNSSSSGGGLLPPTPPNPSYQPATGSSDAGSSSNSTTFAYLPSGSPQLPFAFTPSPHSLPTLAGQGSMRSSYMSPSPPISGRDISALAVIRRPSWSGAARTASYDGGSTTTAGRQAVNMAFPLDDSLDSSFFGSSAARQMLKPSGAAPHPGLSANKALVLQHTGMQGSSSASYTAPRLTYPQDTHDAAGGLHAEESESDILPFAIDGDTAAFDATSPAADGGLSSAEAVVKWLEVHPYLHANLSSDMAHATCSETVDAREELDRLRPLIQAIQEQ
ncbi:hypothetical protein ABBQ38_007134 [Trebouxia sp. C0009 RCD-2024]